MYLLVRRSTGTSQPPHSTDGCGFQWTVITTSSIPDTATISFRINTCKSVSKQTTLSPFRINTYEKHREGVSRQSPATLRIPSTGHGSRVTGHVFRGLFRRSQREEILRAFDGILQAPEELLQVGAAFYEIDVGGIDDQEVGGGVAEEEMFVGAGDFLDVLEGNLRLFARGFFGDARAQHFRLGLKVDDQVGSGQLGSQRFVVAVVELQLFVIQIEVGEDAVLLHQEIGD